MRIPVGVPRSHARPLYARIVPDDVRSSIRTVKQSVSELVGERAVAASEALRSLATLAHRCRHAVPRRGEPPAAWIATDARVRPSGATGTPERQGNVEAATSSHLVGLGVVGTITAGPTAIGQAVDALSPLAMCLVAGLVVGHYPLDLGLDLSAGMANLAVAVFASFLVMGLVVVTVAAIGGALALSYAITRRRLERPWSCLLSLSTRQPGLPPYGLHQHGRTQSCGGA